MFLVLAILAGALPASLGLSGPAQAGEFEEALASLAKAKTKGKIAAIDVIAATGDERAADVLTTFLGGNLYFRKADKKVLIAKKSGAVYVLTDPLTNKEIGQTKKSKIRKIRINNRLRKLLRGVLGGLTLLSKDPAKRRAAADAVFKSRALSALPVLEQAIARETEDNVKERLIMARAAVALDKSKIEAERLAAIATLSAFAVPEVRSLLGAIANSKTSDAVRAAAANALVDIESRLAFWNGVGNVFHGLSLGSVLLLALFGALQFLGTLLSPMFGAAGDRVGRRVIMCSMRAFLAFLAALIMVLGLADSLSPTVVLAIAFLGGLIKPSDIVMRNSLIGDTMPAASLMSALGLSRMTMDTARIVGALAGAGLFAALGIGPAYLFVVAF